MKIFIRHFFHSVSRAIRAAILWALAATFYLIGRVAALITLSLMTFTLWCVAAFVAGYRYQRDRIKL